MLPEGKNFAVSTNFGTYRGETGFGASGVARITDNVFVSGGIGLGTSGQDQHRRTGRRHPRLVGPYHRNDLCNPAPAA